MSKFKISYRETRYYAIETDFAEEIDTSSQFKWDALKQKVLDLTQDESIFSELPSAPSSDLKDWIYLYYFVEGPELKNEISTADPLECLEMIQKRWIVKDSAGNICYRDELP